MGYYGVPKDVMKEVRDEWNPSIVPLFE